MGVSEAIKDAEAEVMKVGHTESAAQQRAQTVIEALGGTITGTVQEVVGDLVQPALKRVTEFIHRVQLQRAGGRAPLPEAGHPGLRGGNGGIVEEVAQGVPLLSQLG